MRFTRATQQQSQCLAKLNKLTGTQATHMSICNDCEMKDYHEYKTKALLVTVWIGNWLD